MDLAHAWKAMTSSGRQLPTGMGLFLKTASVREEPLGTVHVALAQGPARERMADPAVVRAVSEGLSAELGRRVSVVVDAGLIQNGATDPPGRVTADTVREGRLKELVALEPLLGRAVEELDLELLE